MAIAHRSGEVEQSVDDQPTRGDVEELRAKVRVVAHQIQPRRLHHPSHRLRGVFGPQRKAELRVDDSRCDLAMSMHGDAGIEPE